MLLWVWERKRQKIVPCVCGSPKGNELAEDFRRLKTKSHYPEKAKVSSRNTKLSEDSADIQCHFCCEAYTFPMTRISSADNMKFPQIRKVKTLTPFPNRAKHGII